MRLLQPWSRLIHRQGHSRAPAIFATILRMTAHPSPSANDASPIPITPADLRVSGICKVTAEDIEGCLLMVPELSERWAFERRVAWEESRKTDGFAILSEFTRDPAANVEVELGAPSVRETGETGESPQVGARTGKPVSRKATSGEPAPINHSSDKGLDSDKQPPLVPPTAKARRRRAARTDRRCG